MAYFFRELVSTVVHLSMAATSYILEEVDHRWCGYGRHQLHRRPLAAKQPDDPIQESTKNPDFENLMKKFIWSDLVTWAFFLLYYSDPFQYHWMYLFLFLDLFIKKERAFLRTYALLRKVLLFFYLGDVNFCCLYASKYILGNEANSVLKFRFPIVSYPKICAYSRCS